MRDSCRSSPSSAVACILDCGRSRWLDCWWLLVHGLAAASIGLAWPATAGAKLALLAVLAVHGWAARPDAARRLVCDAEGRWALPALGLSGLALGAGTRVGEHWLRLVLEHAKRRVKVLVLADQLPAPEWIGLRELVREQLGRADSEHAR